MNEEPTLYLNFDKSLYRLEVEKIEFSSDIDPDRIISGSSISSISQSIGLILSGKTGFSNDETGYILGNDEGVQKFYIGTSSDYLNFDGTDVTISGTLSAGAIDIGSGANSFHVDSSGNTWWGAVAIGDAVAKVLKTGIATFTKITISGGSNVTFISDTLNTSTKTILKDFTFEDTDFAGNLKTGDITWSTADGSVTGGSGILINAAGLIGANDGDTTFSIDATTGNATFYGTLSAVTGSLGSLTIGGAITVGTSGSIGSGQTAYNTGTGWWLEYNSGTPRFSIGDASTNFLTFDGANVAIAGNVYLYDSSVSDSGTYPSAENFITYTIQNDFGTLSTTSPRASFTLTHTRDPEISGGAFIFKDYGVGHFNSSFTQYLTVCCTVLGDYRTFAYWALSNTIGDMRVHAVGGPLAGIFLYVETSIHSYPTLRGIEYVGGGSFAGYDMTLGVSYYLTIKFDSTVGTYGTLYVNIFSDSARIHSLATRTITLGAAMSYRYLYVYSSYHDNVNLNTSSGFSDTLILGVEEASVTGNSAQMILPSTSDATQRFLINRRKSRHSDDDGVLEIYSDKAPDNSRFNWLFMGRKGYGYSSDWNVSCVDITTKSRFELDHGTMMGPTWLILPSDDTSDVGDPNYGLGVAGSTRQVMAFQADSEFTACTLSSGTFTGGGFMAFGYYGMFNNAPGLGIQMYLDTAGIHFLDSIFGAWEDISSKVDGNAHQSTADGFIVAIGASGNYGTILTDSNNPPTTVRATFGPNSVTNSCATVPVKMGDYYKFSSYGGTPTVYWLPFG